MPWHPLHRRRLRRNIALAASLGALVALFFLLTLAKLGGAP